MSYDYTDDQCTQYTVKVWCGIHWIPVAAAVWCSLRSWLFAEVTSSSEQCLCSLSYLLQVQGHQLQLGLFFHHHHHQITRLSHSINAIGPAVGLFFHCWFQVCT
jgi:hypothetical protein